ncbi:hypothetical protein EGW08_009302 [Elysia chlorotica]|uniref:Amino acid permease N-terminal domain-containing protein n=1 Tax=Elysia chlorotica TaxID=188477 RepID=A0A433TN01_ELYCH|nr:hypothetical protein EGW08_009302 [Elysia chlorotica]
MGITKVLPVKQNSMLTAAQDTPFKEIGLGEDCYGKKTIGNYHKRKFLKNVEVLTTNFNTCGSGRGRGSPGVEHRLPTQKVRVRALTTSSPTESTFDIWPKKKAMELKSMDSSPNGRAEMKKSASSRFQVARVDTKENQGKENGADVQPKSNNQRKKSFEFRRKSHDVPKLEIGAKSASSEGPLSAGPESPNATTFSLGGDSLRSRSSVDGYNKTHCVMNTMEALPCVDHYRNVFSATGGGNLKARPTLAELHEERDDEEIRANKKEPVKLYDGDSQGSPNHMDNVQVVTAVRFGWIQGVLLASCFRKTTNHLDPLLIAFSIQALDV